MSACVYACIHVKHIPPQEVASERWLESGSASVLEKSVGVYVGVCVCVREYISFNLYTNYSP